jgi:hypothetical protein
VPPAPSAHDDGTTEIKFAWPVSPGPSREAAQGAPRLEPSPVEPVRRPRAIAIWREKEQEIMTIDADSTALARNQDNPSAMADDSSERISRRGGLAADVENTDLERRVLAHERILQVLIAHMAESEPKFTARLSAVFGDSMQVGRREHDYTDTHAYADQFIRKILRLGDHAQPAVAPDALPERQPALPERRPALPDDSKQAGQDAAARREVAPTLFEVAHRRGIWEVTKDGRFHGHYRAQQPAFDAVEAAAHAAVASGGSADILLRGERPPRRVS